MPANVNMSGAMGDADEAGLWAQPVFSAGGASYTWSDVAEFARRIGEWEAVLQEAREGLACVRAGLAPDPAAVDAAARAFRYRRRLITAEETEAWLAARGLDVAGWMDHVRRSVLRAAHEADASAVTDGEVDRIAWVTAWCGGHFERLAPAFAAEVAARLRPPPEVTPERVHDLVARRRLDWLRVDVQQAVFASEGAAREAVLSVRSDGLSLSEVCGLAGVVVSTRTARLEELDDALRTAVLGAREGQVVGPVDTAEGFAVLVVESKTVPSAEDPEVRERAAAVIAAADLRQAVEEVVEWHDR